MTVRRYERGNAAVGFRGRDTETAFRQTGEDCAACDGMVYGMGDGFPQKGFQGFSLTLPVFLLRQE